MTCDLWGAVTLSSTGVYTSFKEMTTATSGVLARFPWLLLVRNSFASYGASAVTRTSDRGHVAEAKDQCHRSKSGFLIRVSKETLLKYAYFLFFFEKKIQKKVEMKIREFPGGVASSFSA